MLYFVILAAFSLTFALIAVAKRGFRLDSTWSFSKLLGWSFTCAALFVLALFCFVLIFYVA